MSEPKIKLWIARDDDGMLNAFQCKPVRGEHMWFGHGEIPLDEESFSYIDWASEPVPIMMKLVPEDDEDI